MPWLLGSFANQEVKFLPISADAGRSEHRAGFWDTACFWGMLFVTCVIYDAVIRSRDLKSNFFYELWDGLIERLKSWNSLHVMFPPRSHTGSEGHPGSDQGPTLMLKGSAWKNSSMELAVIWGNFSCSDLACSDLANSDLACSDLGCFFVTILTFSLNIHNMGTHWAHTQIEQMWPNGTFTCCFTTISMYLPKELPSIHF